MSTGDYILHHGGVKMLGTRIREARKAAGLTQEQLAEMAELNRVTVAVLESEGHTASSRRNRGETACYPAFLSRHRRHGPTPGEGVTGIATGTCLRIWLARPNLVSGHHRARLLCAPHVLRSPVGPVPTRLAE
jgi:hypothetical protein